MAPGVRDSGDNTLKKDEMAQVGPQFPQPRAASSSFTFPLRVGQQMVVADGNRLAIVPDCSQEATGQQMTLVPLRPSTNCSSPSRETGETGSSWRKPTLTLQKCLFNVRHPVIAGVCDL